MPTDSDVLCLRNGTLATDNERNGLWFLWFYFCFLGYTLYQNVPVGSCSRFEQEEKHSVVFKLNWKRPVGTWPLQLNWRKLATLMLGFCTVLHCFVGKEDSSAVNSELLEYQKWEFYSFRLCCHSRLLVAVVLVVAIVLSLAEVSNLLVANEDNFLKYEYTNEVSSHQEVLYTFCFYPGAHTTAVTSLLTVKCRIGAVVSFSVTMQVAASAGTSY